MTPTLGLQMILRNLGGIEPILFGQTQSTSWFQMILKPEVLPFFVAIVAIVCGCTVGAVTAVTKLVIAHRERMAKIQQGIEPDRPADSSNTQTRR